MSRPCQIVRRSYSGEVDRYGNDLSSESVVSTTCEIQQEERTEEAGGTITGTTWVVFLPVDTDIQSEDALIVGGFEYEMIGDPWKADSGTTAVHHVEATVKRVTGVEEAS